MNKYASIVTSTNLFFIFLIVGIVFRFYNLNWGSPYYFHPDERQNIAYPILNSTSLFLRDQENFDINPLPLTIIKASYEATKIFNKNTTQDPIVTILIISRVISAILSVVISLLIFVIGIKFISKLAGFIGFYLSILSVGLIQYAHFGTIEILEAFLFLSIIALLLTSIKTRKQKLFLPIGFVFALAVATKFLSFFLLPSIGVGAIFVVYSYKKKLSLKVIKSLQLALFFSVGFLIGTFLFFPKLLLEPKVFEKSLNFESQVALGTLPVFYTQGFYDTTPIAYHLLHIFPFLINPILTLLIPFSVGWTLWYSVAKKDAVVFVVLIAFLSLFIGQSFLFVKWARYMIPSLPFLYILIAFTTATVLHSIKIAKNLRTGLLLSLIGISFIFALSFVITVYISPSTILSAREYARENIPENARIIAEPYDIGTVPFTQAFPNITFFNFYDLDSLNAQKELELVVKNSDYVLLTSPRILRSRIHSPKQFPSGNTFYKNLVGQNGFKLLYQTPCNIFCKITYLNDPVYQFEETITVFDRPHIMIFEKQ